MEKYTAEENRFFKSMARTFIGCRLSKEEVQLVVKYYKTRFDKEVSHLAVIGKLHRERILILKAERKRLTK